MIESVVLPYLPTVTHMRHVSLASVLLLATSTCVAKPLQFLDELPVLSAIAIQRACTQIDPANAGLYKRNADASLSKIEPVDVRDTMAAPGFDRRIEDMMLPLLADGRRNALMGRCMSGFQAPAEMFSESVASTD
jgi:hypothetical protein